MPATPPSIQIVWARPSAGPAIPGSKAARLVKGRASSTAPPSTTGRILVPFRGPVRNAVFTHGHGARHLVAFYGPCESVLQTLALNSIAALELHLIGRNRTVQITIVELRKVRSSQLRTILFE